VLLLVIVKRLYQDEWCNDKNKDKQFCCGHNIVTEGVFVTELCSDVRI